MLKTTGKRANFARLCESGVALGIALAITLGGMLSVLVAPIRDSRAAEGDRPARMAQFARPAAVPFPPKNPYSAEKAELGRKLFSTP
jgi:hypothetical protein